MISLRPIVLTLACAAALSAAALARERFTVTQNSGSGGAQAFLQTSASGGALQGETASSVNSSIRLPFGVLGEYDAAGSTFGIGVVGISTTGYAVGAEALSTQPSILAYPGGGGIGLEAVTPSGTSTAPAIYAESAANGPAIQAVTDTSNPAASIVGTHLSTNGDSVDAILGTTVNGRAGVEGNASGSATAAMLAIATGSSPGMIAQNTSGTRPQSPTSQEAIYAYSLEGPGVEAISAGGQYAGQFLSTGGAYSTTYALDAQATGSGGVGVSAYGSEVGFETEKASGSNLYPSSGVVGTGTSYGLGGVVSTTGSSYPLYLSSTTGEVAYVDNSGALYTKNGYHTFARTRGGYGVEAYVPRSSAPTVEDVGEGRLAGGTAIVRLDPAVVESLDQSSRYHVFLTPEADTNGLYVEQKAPNYFVVRETRGGRGTFAFDYRIVGDVDGQGGKRMVLTTKKRMEDGQPAFPRTVQAARVDRATIPRALAPQKTANYVPAKVRPLAATH